MEIARNAIKAVLFLAFAFNASIWLFVIGYKLYMPKAQFQTPLNFNHAQERISATVDLHNFSIYLNRWATKYSISIHLIVPNNKSNVSLGNFMINLSGEQFNNTIPMMLRYESFIVKTVKCLLRLPFYLTGYWWEEQHLRGCLVKDSKIHPQTLSVTILNGSLQIYCGYLVFEAKLSILQQVYHRYFIPASLISIWFIFSYLVISSSIVAIFMYWKNHQKEKEEPEETFGLENLFQ